VHTPVLIYWGYPFKLDLRLMIQMLGLAHLRSQIVTSRFLGRCREQMAPHCTNVGVGPDNVILYGKLLSPVNF